jgi:hypothetical protein
MGSRPGYVFKKGVSGQGYYVDKLAVAAAARQGSRDPSSVAGRAAAAHRPSVATAPPKQPLASTRPVPAPPSFAAKPASVTAAPVVKVRDAGHKSAGSAVAVPHDGGRRSHDDDMMFLSTGATLGDDDADDDADKGESDDDVEEGDMGTDAVAGVGSVSMTFESLGLCAPLVEACRALGWKKPSEIQIQALPSALQGIGVSMSLSLPPRRVCFIHSQCARAVGFFV